MAYDLTPLKEPSTSNFKFGVCDIEVDNWTKFLCIGYYDGYNDVEICDEIVKVLAQETYQWFDQLFLFLQFLGRHCFNNDITTVFAHFGGKFDFNFILGKICENFDKFDLGDMIPRGSGVLCFDITYKNLYGFKLTFRDSSALLPSSLRSLTNTFNVEVKKGEIEYDQMGRMWKSKRGREKILDYLHDDCKGLWQVLNTFYKWPLVQKAGMATTTASQALKIYRTFMPDDLVIQSLDKVTDKFIRRGYFGGRVEIFRPVFDASYDIKKNPSNLPESALEHLKKQKKYKKIYYYDVNSLFPTAMTERDFPISVDFQTSKAEDYDPKGLGFWEVTVDVPSSMWCPPLATKQIVKNKDEEGNEAESEKLIFPTGVFKTVASIAEIEYAKSVGVIVLCYHFGIVLKNGGKIFDKYVNELYEKRVEAKNNKDEASSMLFKLILNSTYGKFGQSYDNKDCLMLDEGEIGMVPHFEINLENGNKARFGTKKKSTKRGFANVAIAAYVTAYSRVIMHKIYMQCGKEHLYYTDTDSIFTTKKFKTGDNLGELKLEYACQSACFLLPKTYINDKILEKTNKDGTPFLKKITMKGFEGKKIKNFTFEDFMLSLYGDTKRLRIVMSPKFATLKTALRKGQFVCMANDPVTDAKVASTKLAKFKNYSIQLNEMYERFNNLTDIKEMENKANMEKEIKSVKTKIRALEKKLEKGFEESIKSIQTSYDKRIVSKDGFTSEPIYLRDY